MFLKQKTFGKRDLMFQKPWTGVLPATLCPFNDDDSIDERGLREYVKYLASVDGITGLVCNGHTGEVMSLRNHERARVTEIIADEVGHKVKVVSGVCAEGSDEAIAQAIAAKDVGADAILLMPPHHWLRFGRDQRDSRRFLQRCGGRRRYRHHRAPIPGLDQSRLFAGGNAGDGAVGPRGQHQNGHARNVALGVRLPQL